MSFRTYIPVAEVRGHVVRAWRQRKPSLMGWSPVETDVWVYLLDDGRLVGQDWERGREHPFGHYIKARKPEAVERKIGELTEASWQEYTPDQVVVIGGRGRP